MRRQRHERGDEPDDEQERLPHDGGEHHAADDRADPQGRRGGVALATPAVRIARVVGAGRSGCGGRRAAQHERRAPDVDVVALAPPAPPPRVQRPG
ncbi:hypothetical protein, partial [Cellulomonas biazotea]|uniref:hypothetical protein n=1 Tax=Cellulomonas biazotea TaxID=1709 RepID=UPI001C3F6390